MFIVQPLRMRLYAGVADQLQTNYASDLRHMLKFVFDSFTSDDVARLDAAEDAVAAPDSFYQQSVTNASSGGFPPSSRNVTGGQLPYNNSNHRSATSIIGTLTENFFCR